MAKIKEIRNRIKSVKATHKITRTMEMVAAGRMKRAMDRMLEARPFVDGFADVIGELVSGDLPDHELLASRTDPKREAVVILSSNRGLCGAFNTNLVRKGLEVIRAARAEGREVEIFTVGKKVTSLLRFQGETIDEPSEMPDRPSFADAVALCNKLVARFTASEGSRVDRVTVVSAKYETALRQPPASQQVLPIAPPESETSALATDATIYSPERAEILAKLLPLYLRSAVFQAFLETSCSEQVARRNAMKSATENAEEMTKSLTRNLNKARQAQITSELAEIVGGAQALE